MQVATLASYHRSTTYLTFSMSGNAAESDVIISGEASSTRISSLFFDDGGESSPTSYTSFCICPEPAGRNESCAFDSQLNISFDNNEVDAGEEIRSCGTNC